MNIKISLYHPSGYCRTGRKAEEEKSLYTFSHGEGKKSRSQNIPITTTTTKKPLFSGNTWYSLRNGQEQIEVSVSFGSHASL